MRDRDHRLAAAGGRGMGEHLPTREWLSNNNAARFHLEMEHDGRRHILAIARSLGYETYSTGWVGVLMQEMGGS